MATQRLIDLTGTVQQTIKVTPRDLGHALMAYVFGIVGQEDAGVDLVTDANGCTYYAGNPQWQVSALPEMAALVDAGNILINGHVLKLEAVQA